MSDLEQLWASKTDEELVEAAQSMAGYTVWLGLYRWLAARTQHIFWIYTVIVLVFIPVVVLVDPIQMQRGQFTLGGGYTIWTDALIGQVVMWSPVVFYELIRRRFAVTNQSAA